MPGAWSWVGERLRLAKWLPFAKLARALLSLALNCATRFCAKSTMVRSRKSSGNTRPATWLGRAW
jgi:hypothetical protein